AVEESEAGNQDSYNENVSFEQSSESEKSSESHSLEKSSELHSKESKAGNQDSYNENVSFEQSSEAEKSSESHSLEYLNNQLEALNKAVSTNTAAIKSLIENTNDNSNNEPNATIKNYTGETSKQSETQDSVDCAGQTKEVLNPNIQVSNRFSNLNTEESNADDVDVTQNDLVTARTEPATKPKQVNEKYNRRHHTGSKETKQTYHHPRPNVAIVGDSMLKHINPTQLRRSTRSFNTQIKTFPGAKVSDMEYYVKPTLARTPDHLILHVGTNDVRQSTPQEITNAISMLGQQIKKELPTTNLAISEVITRNDDPSLNTKITELNTKLSQQHIQTPTRTTYNSSSLIDLILTHINDDKTLEAGVVDLGISDHSLVYICRKISIPKEPPKIVFTRQFKNYNSHQFKEELSYYTNLDPTSNDPNVLWNEFKNNFLTIAEKHAPVRQRRVKSEHKPWLTKEIKRLMHHRDYLKRQSVRLTSSNYNEAYKRCKNKLNKLIKKTKEEYFKTKLFNANNSKESWQAINELLNKKPKTTHVTQLNVDDQVITGDTNIADCFNQYFSSIGCKLSKNVQNINVDPMTFVTPTESSFHFSCILVQETFDALNQLNSRKSPGLDGISVKLLKDTSDVIAQPLANIFNLSLQTAIFPDEWKIAKVSPVFKEGNKTDCGNYRPISVISVVAKLFEGLVYNQLRTFIADNSILVEQQSGFRSQHSTETALLGSTNEWLYNMDSGLINGVLFLDLKKAFDTVDHEILLKKLHLYGIKGTTYAWFESYIQNRKSICLMNGKKSHAREIRCGVPQGSNLGPILFLLYINDLPKCLETTKANLFADDTNLSCAGLDANEIETKLKRDLENVHSWLRSVANENGQEIRQDETDERRMSMDEAMDATLLVSEAAEECVSVHEANGMVSVPAHAANEQLNQEHLEHRQCTICKEAWPTRQNLTSELYICYRCKRDKKSPKKFSAENDMDPGIVPEQLRDIQSFLNRLPSRVADLPVLIVRRHGAENTHRDFTVRRHRVLESVFWMKTNNSFFKDIEIDRDIILSLPENGIPDELSVEELVLGHGSTSFILMRQRRKKDGAAIQDAVNEVDPLDWPSTEGNLVNEFNTDGLATGIPYIVSLWEG
ncbi:Hypothetical predicted protein, partial [Paramuricea clavata]